MPGMHNVPLVRSIVGPETLPRPSTVSSVAGSSWVWGWDAGRSRIGLRVGCFAASSGASTQSVTFNQVTGAAGWPQC